jgi:hypothetical protein
MTTPFEQIKKLKYARHSGMDAGIQPQGCETIGLHFCSIEHPKYRPWHWIPASMPE